MSAKQKSTMSATKPKRKVVTKEPVRLYSRGIVTGYQRSKTNQYESRSLIKIEGVATRQDARFYCGKRVAYIYRGNSIKHGHKYRIVWGKVQAPHGNSGLVRAKFATNLPPKSFGNRVRVFLYPSNI